MSAGGLQYLGARCVFLSWRLVIQIKRRGRRLRLKYREGKKYHYIEALIPVVLTQAVVTLHMKGQLRHPFAEQMC